MLTSTPRRKTTDFKGKLAHRMPRLIHGRPFDFSGESDRPIRKQIRRLTDALPKGGA